MSSINFPTGEQIIKGFLVWIPILILIISGPIILLHHYRTKRAKDSAQKILSRLFILKGWAEAVKNKRRSLIRFSVFFIILIIAGVCFEKYPPESGIVITFSLCVSFILGGLFIPALFSDLRSISKDAKERILILVKKLTIINLPLQQDFEIFKRENADRYYTGFHKAFIEFFNARPMPEIKDKLEDIAIEISKGLFMKICLWLLWPRIDIHAFRRKG